MADIVSPRRRSEMMARIRGRDTKPEMIVRRFLHGNGFRYQLHVRSLPGNPDLVFPKHHACLFVHGCYWHRHSGCRLAYTPKSRITFWNNKFNANIARDRRAQENLIAAGWRVGVIWECAIRDGLDLAAAAAWLRGTNAEFELP